MGDDEQRNAPERDTTDQSLRAERHKTDAELAAALGSIKEHADGVVAEARQTADAVLNDARQQQDRVAAAEGVVTETAAQKVGDERAVEDAAVSAERGGADAAADDGRARRQRALASLLAFERNDTDVRLRIERARADEAVTSREDFLAIVSHDLRTLLAGISLSADVLATLPASTDSAPKVARSAERILRLTSRMNRLVGDLVDVGSIEAGRLGIAPAACEATTLVQDSIDAFQLAASQRSITLAADIGEVKGPCDLDHERVMQVLTNLVGNAIKFTAPGGRIVVGVRSDGDEVVFSVSDTGKGIPEGRLEQIFDRFFQVSETERRGLGLGLYISRSIVEAHGGRIWVNSTLGQGSTFHLALPARANPDPFPAET